jgi:hypothetical protein
MANYQHLFDPPSQDDLEYLPDPLGRLEMGSYVEKPADIPDPGWEVARGDWMDGAPLGQIFGDGLFDLQSGVGAGQANRRGDVFKLQALLHREGVLDAAATEGPTGYWGGRDDYALRKFQKENGLAIDGYALPDGETISTIREFYRPPLGIRTTEKRGGYPEPELRPIGLGSDRPMSPTLLSSDLPRGAFADATGAGPAPTPAPEAAPSPPGGMQYVQATPMASDAPQSPAAVGATPQHWLVDEAGLNRLRDIAANNTSSREGGAGTYLYPGKTASQECVALVQAVLPDINVTKTWKPAAPIKAAGDPPLQPGTAIATFKDGIYENKSGYHAAIFLGYGQDAAGRDGIRVLDQWKGQPAHERFIRFNDKAPRMSNNAGAFSVIQSPPLRHPSIQRPAK